MKYTQFNYRPYEAHRMVYDMISPNSDVLDMGCATGYFAKELINKNCRVVGVDIDLDALKQASKYCVKVINADFENIEAANIPKMSFDYILLLDVIEHLGNGEIFLKKIHQYLRQDGYLILSTPNIAHISVRLNLLRGNFDYENLGIMDRTHVHFYTKRTLLEIINTAKWDVKLLLQTADFGQIPLVGRWARFIPKFFQNKLTNCLPTILGVQWVAKCGNKSK